jgi:hypothetical protein
MCTQEHLQKKIELGLVFFASYFDPEKNREINAFLDLKASCYMYLQSCSINFVIYGLFNCNNENLLTSGRLKSTKIC